MNVSKESNERRCTVHEEDDQVQPMTVEDYGALIADLKALNISVEEIEAAYGRNIEKEI
jgi:hypothetical protein